MTKKTIYNPVTNKYYPVKNKTTKRGEIGQIKGLWNFNNTDSVMCQHCLGSGRINGELIHPPKILILRCYFENRPLNLHISINCPYCDGIGMVVSKKGDK